MARIFDAGSALNEPKVHDIITMGRHTNDQEAKVLLTNIAKQVQPIMRKRNWLVPKLSEFFPTNSNLLGLNIGGGGGRTREIKVRLRSARDPLSLLPYHDVLGTMLHELVHNVRGPHDSTFYKLLEELQTECEDLISRGVSGSGSGFDGPSCGRLGSHAFIPLHNPSATSMREAALKAAEERAKKQRVMTAGPQKLGRGVFDISVSLDPRAAAAQAAERRCRDNLWCPCEQISRKFEDMLRVRSPRVYPVVSRQARSSPDIITVGSRTEHPSTAKSRMSFVEKTRVPGAALVIEDDEEEDNKNDRILDSLFQAVEDEVLVILVNEGKSGSVTADSGQGRGYETLESTVDTDKQSVMSTVSGQVRKAVTGVIDLTYDTDE